MNSSHPHTHVQDTPSDTWTISHGMGQNPGVFVSVYDGDPAVLTGILPKNIAYPEVGTVVITFSIPRTGEARLT